MIKSKQNKKQHIYYCIMQLSNKCKNKQGLLNSTDFYMASNQIFFKNKKVPICKHCIKEYCYVNEEFNLNKFKTILRLIDIPFLQREFETAFNDEKETIGSYMKNVQLNYKGMTWANGEHEYSDKMIINNKLIKNTFELTPKMIKFWGKSYSKEDIEFLEEYYNDLIKMYDHSLPVQVNNYRNMAKTQLQANKCLENGDMSGYDKAMKILSMLSGDSNIKPNQETSVGNVSKGGFDIFIKHIEDNEPIMDWEKDLGHIDKLKSMLNIFFFGNLARALNIRNPWKNKFDKEMKQYTVDNSEKEEDKKEIDFLNGID